MNQPISDVEIENRFTYHSPHGDQPQRYEKLRSEAKKLAYLIRDLCPDSRERSTAMTHLENTIFWANASIARSSGSYGPLMESPVQANPPAQAA